MQSFKIIALLALTDSGGYVKFTPKFTIVGGEVGGAGPLRVQTSSFGYSEPR